MDMAKPEAKNKTGETESEWGEVKEKKPTESLIDSIAGILTSIVKVKDLRGAQVVLQEAQRLKDEGDSDGARDLALEVFEQLKRIGESEELPEKAEILAMANQGEYGKMAKLVERGKRDIKGPGQRGKWKQVGDRAQFVEDDLKGFERKKERALKEEKDLSDKVRTTFEKREKQKFVEKHQEKQAGVLGIENNVAEQLKERAVELAETEAELHHEVMENVERLVGQLEGEKKLKKKKELMGEYDDMLTELKMSGRSELSLGDVQATKKKLGEVWREMSKRGDEIVDKLKEKAAESEKAARGKEPWPIRMVRKLQGEKMAVAAVVARTKQLAKTLNAIEDKLKLGMSFEQVCKELNPDEIGPIMLWFENLEVKSKDRSYDPVLAELNKNLVEDPEGFRLFARLVENVKIGYGQQRYEEAAEGMRARGYRAPQTEREYIEGYAQPFDIDPATGMPRYGRSKGETEFNLGGVDFLQQRWRAPWVEGWMRARSHEEEVRSIREQRVQYNQEMMNVNFQSLIEDVPEFAEYLDLEAINQRKPVRLKEELRNNEKKQKEFQMLWLQQMLFEQRLIAYEGVFSSAHQDARVTRYNTLMQIMDVGTELKGLARFHSQMFGAVDKQQNSFVNEDALNEMIAMWVGQGPGFRLEDMLKEYRENLYVYAGDGKDKGKRINVRNRSGEIVDVSVYDVLHKLRSEVTAEDKAKFNALFAEAGDDLMPENMSRHYGTMMLRRTESNKRNADRKLVFFSVMEDLDVDVDSLTDTQKDWLFGKYQSYLDMGVNYLWTHKELHQAVGNASFIVGTKLNKEGEMVDDRGRKVKYELPQGLPEMLYKADFKLCMDYFRIYSVGGAAKDAFVFGDSGMRDDKTMAKSDFGNHLFSVETTTQGAPGILEAFFGGKSANKKHAEAFKQMMEKAIFHHGYFNKKDMVSLSTKIGDASNLTSGTRRSDSMTTRELKKIRVTDEFVEAIEWGTADNPGVFAKIVKNPRLIKVLTSDKLTVNGKEITDNKELARLKWNAFVERYGDDYYSTTAANAKRMDHFTKYGLKSHFEWYAAELAWQMAPTNNTKAVEALNPASAVNAGIVPQLSKNFMEYLAWANEKIGQRWWGGGKTKRLKLNETQQIQWRTDVGMMGQGDSEWPMMQSEDLTNPAFTIFNPIVKRTSVNASRNVGTLEDEQAMKNMAEDLQRAGKLSVEDYTKYVKEHVIKSFFWSKKESPFVNLWRLVTLEAAYEYMGSMWFNIPGHMLREALREANKEELEKLSKYFSS